MPPLVTFTTEIFHPLLTPLTTYTYTTSSTDSDTVSATDEERLPPGGFSLRHGFSQWFGRSRRIHAGSIIPSLSLSRGTESPTSESGTDRHQPSTPLKSAALVASSPAPGASPLVGSSPLSVTSSSTGFPASGQGAQISIIDVLRYIRSTFDDEDVLDSVPLEAAGNPGAWHAWRTHRLRIRAGLDSDLSGPALVVSGDQEEAKSTDTRQPSTVPSGGGARRPGEWNWEGVWEERARRGIEGSLVEPVLYGDMRAGDDLIRFLNMDGDMVKTVQDNIKRSVRAPAGRGTVMSSTTNPAVVGALILLPIVIVVGTTFCAIKASEVGGVKWEQFKAWRRAKTYPRKRKSSNATSSDNTV
ncbi:MAG: hypothetical protein M1832_001044 [Thelocarpon impressellum]|nr:MAG: hypothetical protein M1832_001044 [Thelocarpon impressellum]